MSDNKRQGTNFKDRYCLLVDSQPELLNTRAASGQALFQ